MCGARGTEGAMRANAGDGARGPGRRMESDPSARAQLRRAYSLLRTRLLAERKLEETRLAQTRETLSRIDRELMAVERDQRKLELRRK